MENRVIDTAAPELMRAAASRRGWPDVLRQLGLAATEENIHSFRVRALSLGIDVSHLRRRRHLERMSAATLGRAAAGAASQAQVLERLGLRPGGSTYAALARAAAAHGIALPTRRSHVAGGKPGQVDRSDDEIRAAYDGAASVADVLRRLGLVPRGDNYRVIKTRLIEMGLDPQQLMGQRWSRGRPLPRVALQDMLVRGRACSGVNLAKRLIEARLLPRRCASCGSQEWMGNCVPLELDHINGEHDDNRLENLRLLCPNCHALTDTYRGRNIARRRNLRTPARVLE